MALRNGSQCFLRCQGGKGKSKSTCSLIVKTCPRWPSSTIISKNAAITGRQCGAKVCLRSRCLRAAAHVGSPLEPMASILRERRKTKKCPQTSGPMRAKAAEALRSLSERAAESCKINLIFLLMLSSNFAPSLVSADPQQDQQQHHHQQAYFTAKQRQIFEHLSNQPQHYSHLMLAQLAAQPAAQPVQDSAVKQELAAAAAVAPTQVSGDDSQLKMQPTPETQPLGHLLQAPEHQQQQRPHLQQVEHHQNLYHQNPNQLHHNQHDHQRQSYWSNDLAPAASNQPTAAALDQFSLAPDSAAYNQNQHQSQGQQYIAYRQLAANPSGSTTPTISRQILAPPPFYDLALSPMNTLDTADGSEEPTSYLQQHQNRVNGARSLMSQGLSGQEIGGARPGGGGQFAAGNQEQQQQQSSRQEPMTAESSNQSVKVEEQEKSSGGGGQAETNAASGTGAQANESNGLVDKSIEPRQRRRIFNRILKKAEWNHLFVELSKVFLKYFLDLALKDIIGKQNGGEGTTSRKKLDAQSELTDLLKDFVKTAISNI